METMESRLVKVRIAVEFLLTIPRASDIVGFLLTTSVIDFLLATPKHPRCLCDG